MSTATRERKSPRARLITMLMQPDGRSVDELSQALGWQIHTTRAVISRLQKGACRQEEERCRRKRLSDRGPGCLMAMCLRAGLDRAGRPRRYGIGWRRAEGLVGVKPLAHRHPRQSTAERYHLGHASRSPACSALTGVSLGPCRAGLRRDRRDPYNLMQPGRRRATSTRYRCRPRPVHAAAIRVEALTLFSG